MTRIPMQRFETIPTYTRCELLENHKSKEGHWGVAELPDSERDSMKPFVCVFEGSRVSLSDDRA